MSQPKEHIDPVCGMTVEESSDAIQTEYKSQTYYFCSPGCKRDFDKEPEKYVSKSAS
jgi:YHS domain-containing protein